MRDSSPTLRTFVLWLGLCCLLPCVATAEPAIFFPRDRIHPVFAAHGIAVSQEARASAVGLDILKKGGNAVDAAVAIGFALAVTLSQAGNLGGGGFMLSYDARTGQTEAIDFREIAPAAAGRDQYLNDAAQVDEQRIRFSHQAAGVPGTVAGLALAHQHHGRLVWRQLLEPARQLAAQGRPSIWPTAQALSLQVPASCSTTKWTISPLNLVLPTLLV